jgi:hypothetical protein
MATARQIAANRLNARRSTGPRSLAGKRRSRRNALRHGLGAQSIVDVFESVDDYRSFERSIVRAYRPASAVDQELVARLVSLLWRLRRASAIESGLFALQGASTLRPRRPDPEQLGERLRQGDYGNLVLVQPNPSASPPTEPPPHDVKTLANTFQRLSNRSGDAFDRLRRYEVTLWRQVAQIVLLLGRPQQTSIEHISNSA